MPVVHVLFFTLFSNLKKIIFLKYKEKLHFLLKIIEIKQIVYHILLQFNAKLNTGKTLRKPWKIYETVNLLLQPRSVCICSPKFNTPKLRTFFKEIEMISTKFDFLLNLSYKVYRLDVVWGSEFPYGGCSCYKSKNFWKSRTR